MRRKQGLLAEQVLSLSSRYHCICCAKAALPKDTLAVTGRHKTHLAKNSILSHVEMTSCWPASSDLDAIQCLKVSCRQKHHRSSTVCEMPLLVLDSNSLTVSHIRLL